MRVVSLITSLEYQIEQANFHVRKIIKKKAKLQTPLNNNRSIMQYRWLPAWYNNTIMEALIPKQSHRLERNNPTALYKPTKS